MPVSVQRGRVCPPSLEQKVRVEALKLLSLCGVDKCELSILLTDDPTIKSLNRRYLKKNRPTDVLSFPQFEASEIKRLRTLLRKDSTTAPPYCLGDIVISLDTARRQARALGISLANNVRRLMIHGFLHLLGYDHERSDAEARRMFLRERILWNKLERLK